MSQTSFVIAALNRVLKNQLTAINQYFLHARILKHMGLMPLADHEYKKSIDEMKHADMIVERILALGGLPNLQSLGDLAIGKLASDIMQCDNVLGAKIRFDLETAINTCEQAQDVLSTEMLQCILVNNAEHLMFITQQQG